MSFEKHLILDDATVFEALAKLDFLAADAILFVIDSERKLLGSLTDGDVRRGLLKGFKTDQSVKDFIQKNPKFISKTNYSLEDIIKFRNGNFKIIPILDDFGKVINVINFRLFKSYLPVDAVIMAGGRGERLKPLTDSIPKPMLKVGDKPIIEHNIDRLINFGIDDFWISIRYLGDQISDYLGDGKVKGVEINYLNEDFPLGTIGAVGKIQDFKHNIVLVTNSDILTNINYEDFYLSFVNSGADLSVVTIPYDVSIPYAVLETDNEFVVSFKEKPTYTYFSNGGIYLIKKEILRLIPEDSRFDATELMEEIINKGGKVHSYPLHGYWLDIGKHEDFKKAETDIKHINLK